jgi:hypothetical protein
VLRFNLVVFGVYRIQGITKEEFVANLIQVEMQHYHLYTARHVATTYQAKHEIVNGGYCI